MPTEISYARAFAADDDALRAPSRAGTRARSRASRKSVSRTSRLLAAIPFPCLSTGAVVGCAAFCALMTGVVVNALFLQTDKHSAPMFPPEAAAASAAPAQRVNARAVEAPAPRAVVAPEIAPPPLPPPRPAAREITGSLARQPDGVDALLAAAPAAKRVARPRAEEAVAARKPVAAAPTRSQPTKAVAEHRRAAAPKPKSVAAGKPAAAKDKSNSAAITHAISDEMRNKLAAISGAPVKAKPARRVAADDEE